MSISIEYTHSHRCRQIKRGVVYNCYKVSLAYDEWRSRREKQRLTKHTAAMDHGDESTQRKIKKINNGNRARASTTTNSSSNNNIYDSRCKSARAHKAYIHVGMEGDQHSAIVQAKGLKLNKS